MLFWSLSASAVVNVPKGHYKIYAFLSLHGGPAAELVVNPATRNAYVIRIKNPGFVAKALAQNSFAGQVEVEFDLNPVQGELNYSAVAIVRTISASDLPRLPHYDGPLTEVR